MFLERPADFWTQHLKRRAVFPKLHHRSNSTLSFQEKLTMMWKWSFLLFASICIAFVTVFWNQHFFLVTFEKPNFTSRFLKFVKNNNSEKKIIFGSFFSSASFFQCQNSTVYRHELMRRWVALNGELPSLQMLFLQQCLLIQKNSHKANIEECRTWRTSRQNAQIIYTRLIRLNKALVETYAELLKIISQSEAVRRDPKSLNELKLISNRYD